MSIAFVFPGQGSQQVGMMDGYVDDRAVRATFDEASALLGEDLWQLAAEGPAEAQNLTRNTQPLLLTASVAIWRAWQAAGGATPSYMAGHSLGEYSALVAAGALAFRDAVPLVRFRAEAMQDAVAQGVGAMAAVIGGDDDAIAQACAEAAQGEIVEPVNYNGPGQVVIAGHRAAVERAMAAAKARGAKRAMLLPVSAPFHSSLLAPAAERLARRLADVDFASPRVPVVHNVDVTTHDTAAAMRDALARQAASPVRWTDTMRYLVAHGVTSVVECGPGRVLAGLARRTDDSLAAYSLTDAAALAEARTALA
ncbi:MAG TPA: ACP S-malonyltransferase [Casimicrobiaceae bacterium]|jgi:[acyl-carrier-protein] S-malonyltransferase|nr:ACP S-malonyltransferase [Casimicrobiaceae bacterium]